MTINNNVAMIPSDCARHLFHTAQHSANLPITVREAFDILHKLKMRTDESEISNRCQDLINVLFKKYPDIVACPQEITPHAEATL